MKLILCYTLGHKYAEYHIDEEFQVGGKRGITQKKLDTLGYYLCARCGDKLTQKELRQMQEGTYGQK